MESYMAVTKKQGSSISTNMARLPRYSKFKKRKDSIVF